MRIGREEKCHRSGVYWCCGSLAEHGRDVDRVRDGVETDGRIAISGAGATGPVFTEPWRWPEPPTKWYVLPRPDGCGREGGAEGEGIGSTDDCRCKYTPSYRPLSLPSFLRTT